MTDAGEPSGSDPVVVGEIMEAKRVGKFERAFGLLRKGRVRGALRSLIDEGVENDGPDDGSNEAKDEQVSEPDSRQVEQIFSSQVNNYRLIADELNLAGMGSFEVQRIEDRQELSRLRLDWGRAAVRKRGQGDWSLFDGMAQEVSEIKESETESRHVLVRRRVREMMLEETRNQVSSDEELKAVLQERFRNPAYLPTKEEVALAFPTKEEFDDYCREFGSYEVPTLEMVESLGAYLGSRLGSTPTRIVEVGAGNGRLFHLLARELELISREKHFDEFFEYELQACDDYSWRSEIDEDLNKMIFEVEKLDYREALDKYKPQIVICSWMPPNEDWSRAFLEQGVREYVLIGSEGVTGNSDTWSMGLGGVEGANKYRNIPLSGLQARNLGAELVRGQLCFLDEPPYEESESTVTAFKRISE